MLYIVYVSRPAGITCLQSEPFNINIVKKMSSHSFLTRKQETLFLWDIECLDGSHIKQEYMHGAVSASFDFFIHYTLYYHIYIIGRP